MRLHGLRDPFLSAACSRFVLGYYTAGVVRRHRRGLQAKAKAHALQSGERAGEIQLAEAARVAGDPLYLQDPEALFRLVELPGTESCTPSSGRTTRSAWERA